MKTEEVFKILNTNEPTTSYLVTMKNGNQICGRCAGLVIRDSGMKMSIESRQTIYANTLLDIQDIDSILSYNLDFENFSDIRFNLDCESNIYLGGYLEKLRNDIVYNLNDLKEKYEGKVVECYLKERIDKEPYIKGIISGMHDVNLVLSQHKLTLNWIIDIVTNKGIKQVSLNEIKEIYITMN